MFDYSLNIYANHIEQVDPVLLSIKVVENTIHEVSINPTFNFIVLLKRKGELKYLTFSV